jgi:hypothetical protein
MFTTILAYILANYVKVMAFYILGGAIYATLKWTFKLVKLRSVVNAIPPPGGNIVDVARYTQDKRENAAYEVFGIGQYPPLVSSNKARMFGWAVIWPLNLIWTMVADVAREVWGWMYRTFGRILQSIATAILPK